jgi:hypothetical protein
VRRRKTRGEYLGSVVISGRNCKVYMVDSVRADQWSFCATYRDLNGIARTVSGLHAYHADAGPFGRKIARTKPRWNNLYLIVPGPSASA